MGSYSFWNLPKSLCQLSAIIIYFLIIIIIIIIIIFYLLDYTCFEKVIHKFL